MDEREMPPSEFGGKVDPRNGLVTKDGSPRPLEGMRNWEKLRMIYQTGTEDAAPATTSDTTEATMTGLLPASVQEELMRQAGLLDKGVEL